MDRNSGRRGIPAMAYPTTNTLLPMSSTLLFKRNEHDAQATLCLQIFIFLQGFEDAQPFILQYDADNVISGTVSLSPVAIKLSQTHLLQIARSGGSQIRTLSLSLKSGCPVWCPLSQSIAPRHGCDAVFRQLAVLAEATKLCIVFDYRYLNDDNIAHIKRLIEHPEQLSAVPFRYQAGHIRRTDASVFKPCEYVSNAELETDDVTTEDEQPPSYITRRSRHASTSSASLSPIRERAVLSPSRHRPSRPTAKASTAALSPQPPYPRNAFSLDVRQAVHDAVSQVMPSVLETVVPNLLTAPLVRSSSPPSHSSKDVPRLALSTLGILLSKHVTCSLEQRLQTLCDDTLYHASDLRGQADTEYLEHVEDRRLELLQVKEDCIAELDRVTAEKLDMCKEECDFEEQAFYERVEEEALMVYETMIEKFDTYVDTQIDQMKRERGWLNWEKEVLKREKRRFEDVKENVRGERGARAGSSPP